MFPQKCVRISVRVQSQDCVPTNAVQEKTPERATNSATNSATNFWKCAKHYAHACFRFAGMFAGIFAGTFADPFADPFADKCCAHCLRVVCVCEGDLWEERVAFYRSCFAEQTHNGSTGWYRFCCCLIRERKQNKVVASDTDKGPRHQTTSACCISWPNNRWGSVAQAIFGLARCVIQKNLKIKKKYLENFEAKMGSKLSLKFGGRKCSDNVSLRAFAGGICSPRPTAKSRCSAAPASAVPLFGHTTYGNETQISTRLSGIHKDLRHVAVKNQDMRMPPYTTFKTGGRSGLPIVQTQSSGERRNYKTKSLRFQHYFQKNICW